jgi:hypothetical protein
MTGAELLRLHHQLTASSEYSAHALTAVAVHHVQGRGLQGAGGRDDVLEKRLAGERLQDLGQRRLHALAFAGGG